MRLGGRGQRQSTVFHVLGYFEFMSECPFVCMVFFTCVVQPTPIRSCFFCFFLQQYRALCTCAAQPVRGSGFPPIAVFLHALIDW